MSQIDRLKVGTKLTNEALAMALTESIHKMATSKMPFLAWPILATAYKFFMNQALGLLLEKAAIQFNIMWIRLEVGSDAAALEEARQKAIKLVKEGAKDEDLDEADLEMRRAFDRLHRGGRGRL
jgi:hypothetical protein